MSLREIEEKVMELTPDERWHIAALIRFLEDRDNPEYLRKLEEADARIESGRGLSIDSLQQKL